MFWGNVLQALQSEATRNTEYEERAETYNIVWLMDKLKFLCEGVDYHINKFYSAFHTLKAFYMILQQSGETVTKYFDRFK